MKNIFWISGNSFCLRVSFIHMHHISIREEYFMWHHLNFVLSLVINCTNGSFDDTRKWTLGLLDATDVSNKNNTYETHFDAIIKYIIIGRSTESYLMHSIRERSIQKSKFITMMVWNRSNRIFDKHRCRSYEIVRRLFCLHVIFMADKGRLSASRKYE